MAYNGYYIKINGNNFTNPKPKSYKLYPKLIQDLDSERTADGSLHRNVLKHSPPKIELTFPIMTEEQFNTYADAMDSDYLKVEYYDLWSRTYKTWTMYHNDIVAEAINTGVKDKRYINEWSVNLIGY